MSGRRPGSWHRHDAEMAVICPRAAPGREELRVTAGAAAARHRTNRLIVPPPAGIRRSADVGRSGHVVCAGVLRAGWARPAGRRRCGASGNREEGNAMQTKTVAELIAAL